MPGGEVILLVLSWLLTNALTFVIVIVDERRLSADRLERAWPASSRDAAIIAFGVLALPVHFIKTRGHLKSASGVLGFALGLLMGVACIVGVAVISSLLLEAVGWMLGIATD